MEEHDPSWRQQGPAPPDGFIRIKNASENNLKSVSLAFPKNKLIVVTGVSGSGKSSLIFDVLYREAESCYLSSLSSHARQLLGRTRRPDVESVEGLSAAIAIGQKPITASPRSTVGTITGIYDHLRLLFARLGSAAQTEPGFKIERSLFSFNSPAGACPACKGLGVEDRVDPDLLVADEDLTLRQGCMAITAPNGYIIYSQVTMDVLDQVCRAEGFSADIPWKDLTRDQKQVVLYGSRKITIPFGKHTLASRMRWSGITAKPREEGHYKGIIPVMEAILKQKRNKNILRFVRSTKCSACNGARLNANALSVRIHGHDIAGLAAEPLERLQRVLESIPFAERQIPVASAICSQIGKRIEFLKRLGLAYLTSERESATLSAGEGQRMRLAVQACAGLSGVLYIFDEPSIGLHPSDTHRLIEVLKELREQGNTVIVVEHEEEFLRHADWWIDIGPSAGTNGGRVLHNIEPSRITEIPAERIVESRTLSFLKGVEKIAVPDTRRTGKQTLEVCGATEHNLKCVDAAFRLGALNVVTGVSGAGKSTLALGTLGNFLRSRLHASSVRPGACRAIQGWEDITKVIPIDQKPIGRTPRSNPATYTGVFDHIRDLFSALPEAAARGWTKSQFSFNTPGGRCEACQGAGYIEIGMHFMDSVEVPCEECYGRRFHGEILEVTYHGKNIHEVLDLPVEEACGFFSGEPRIRRFLTTLGDLGLGYLKLGQRSSTLSGGEAQRIKLAAELARPGSGHTMYILDEPTTGLHHADVHTLLHALQALVDLNNTVIVIEHHLGLIAAADWVVDLGPGSGDEGGRIVVQGTPEEVCLCEESATGRALREYLADRTKIAAVGTSNDESAQSKRIGAEHAVIQFRGIATHNLKQIDAAVPRNRITVITGPSGSGKSSLAFDTLFAEGRHRFMESYSTYARTRLGISSQADFAEVSGLTPALAVDQRGMDINPRSTVGTLTGIYDLLRLLFSRVSTSGKNEGAALSSLFSFNHQAGACPTCGGLGEITVCDAEMLITNPEKPLLAGALDGTRTGRFYGDPHGQYVATLWAVGQKHKVDFSQPWLALTDQGRRLALDGSGDEVLEVVWKYRRGERSGEHSFSTKWVGLLELVNQEYRRKHADHRGRSMLPLMKQDLCPACAGARLKPEALAYRIGALHIAQLSALSISAALDFFANVDAVVDSPAGRRVAAPLVAEIARRLNFLGGLGLSYLSIDRRAHSLSGGEAQRVKLASQLGTGLSDITYVLDEPTVGLHAADIGRLTHKLRDLQHAGNTLVIVEHDRDVIESADHIIDLGPGAGAGGGRIVASGNPDEIRSNTGSLTGRYLARTPAMSGCRTRSLGSGLSIREASANNLKRVALEIPAGGLVVVTGVSGSGKSTLVFDVIHQSWQRGKASGCSSIGGFGQFQRVIAAQPKLHFSSGEGSPATFTGVFDRIRELFAATEDARKRNLKKKHFSYLEKEGRCANCQGLGRITVGMDFLGDVCLPCEQCMGRRYREEVLACRYQGKDVAEVLAMTAQEAASFFAGHGALASHLTVLNKVGLGYLRLGQPLDTLSGGEAQRLMLSAELSKPIKGKALYLFDEPSTGLHFRDIEHLLVLFHELADLGHTLLIIEHDPQIIAQADWVIDLGPGGGEEGGNVVACGRLPDIMKHPDSATGKYLKNLFRI